MVSKCKPGWLKWITQSSRKDTTGCRVRSSSQTFSFLTHLYVAIQCMHMVSLNHIISIYLEWIVLDCLMNYSVHSSYCSLYWFMLFIVEHLLHCGLHWIDVVHTLNKLYVLSLYYDLWKEIFTLVATVRCIQSNNMLVMDFTYTLLSIS